MTTLMDIINDLVTEVEENYGEFKDPDDYESWITNKLEEYKDIIIDKIIG